MCLGGYSSVYMWTDKLQQFSEANTAPAASAAATAPQPQSAEAGTGLAASAAATGRLQPITASNGQKQTHTIIKVNARRITCHCKVTAFLP